MGARLIICGNMVNNVESCVSMVNNVEKSGQMVNSIGDMVNRARASFHNDWRDFLTVYSEYLVKNKKLSKAVCYEYLRIVKKFLAPWKGDIAINWNDFRPIKQRIEEFLNAIENPNSYRNHLAALKIMFELLGDKGVLKEYKYKAVLPSFSIKAPTLGEVITFDKCIRDKQVRLFYRLAIVSGIRPEHILRLTKGLIDTKNRTINTWLKTYSKKNFFISYYTPELAPELEGHLKTLKTDNTPLFEMRERGLQKAFERTSEKSGVKITPKTCRKFLTNWVRRHGMIPEDTDALTSHLPQSIVARHYLDIFENLRDEYDKATKDLHFFEAS